MLDTIEIKKADGKYKTLEELYDEAKEWIVDALDRISTDEGLDLGNTIRDNNGYDTLYQNNEENINELLEDWSPWDIIQLDYDDYSDFVYLSYGEPEFTDDIWYDLDTDDIARDILNGDYYRDLPYEIKSYVDDYNAAKEELENLNPIREEGNEVLTKYLNCEADVTDLLQFIDRLVKNEKFWEEVE